jgi:phospholipase/carboxylesterase
MTAPVSLDFVHVHVPPAPESEERRTVLLLHGTGGTERDLLEIGAAVAPGARLLGVRGQVLESGMPRFFRRLAEGVFDEPDLIRRAGDLAAFVRSAAGAYAFDADSVVALGYSNGANIAAAMLLLHPGTLHGAMLFRAMVPLVPAAMPLLAGTPVALIQGQLDPIVPLANTERLVSMLSAAGAAVQLHQEPAAHGLTPGDIAVARGWWGRLQRSDA